MMRFRYSFKTRIEYDREIGRQDFLLRAVPSETAFQRISNSSLTVSGCCNLSRQSDSFGNPLQYGRVNESLNFFEFVSDGVVSQTEYCIRGGYNPIFLYETYLTRASPKMRDFFGGIDLSSASNAYGCAASICRALAKRVLFKAGATDVGTTAAEAFDISRGVCQDFAHMAVSLCRCAKIPARYANGLMIGDGESHAWIEIWDGSAWRAFDPANNVPVKYGYIKISSGRDCADCSLNRGVISAVAKQTIKTTVKVSEVI